MNPEIEALLAQYGITPEQFAQMSEAGVFDERMAALQPQMEMAQGAMGQQMPQGRMVSGFYVPPSPMSNIGALAGKVLGGVGMAKGMGQQAGLIDALRGGQQAAGVIGMKDREAERNLYAEILRKLSGSQDPALKDPWGVME